MKYILISFLFILCSCSQYSDYRTQKQVETWRQEALLKIDAEECESKGGVIQGVCMFGLPMCLISYEDGGKSCADSSECKGECRAQNSRLEVGRKATGQCTQSNDPCGCWAQIENGVVTETICAD